jgi:hypothetical protein
MDDFVDVVGCNTRLSGSRGNIKHLSPHLANLPHSFLFFIVQNLDFMSAHEHL